ncbi:MAG: energy transducer TonB [Flavobacterium sp.]|nr:MAG: energy transducer TonB [Flavobacterium sp.]
MKYGLIALLLIAVNTTAFANQSIETIPADTLKQDSISAQFPGGMDLFYNYLKTSIKYPIISRLHGVQGKVMLKFVVDSSGQVSNVKVKKGLDRYTNREAVRIMRLSPKWIPGTIKGAKVSYVYYIPVSFQDTVSLKGAAVMVNGNVIKRYRSIKKMNLNSLPFQIIPPDLSKASLGARYNKKLLAFNDVTPNTKGYDEEHFRTAFKLLQNVDTGKVQLNVAEKLVDLNTWRQYLNKDSILNIYVNTGSVFRTQDQSKLGAITLVTKAGLIRQKKSKDTLIKSILNYRAGKSPLRAELIVIDGYSFNSAAIFNKIDTNIIQYVSNVSPTEAVKLFGSNYENGIIYIYTKRYQANRPITDKEKLLTLIEQFKQKVYPPVDDVIFLDSKNVGFLSLSSLSASDIQYVNIISRDEAKAFFGDQEYRGIIYVHTFSSKNK